MDTSQKVATREVYLYDSGQQLCVEKVVYCTADGGSEGMKEVILKKSLFYYATLLGQVQVLDVSCNGHNRRVAKEINSFPFNHTTQDSKKVLNFRARMIGEKI